MDVEKGSNASNAPSIESRAASQGSPVASVASGGAPESGGGTSGAESTDTGSMHTQNDLMAELNRQGNLERRKARERKTVLWAVFFLGALLSILCSYLFGHNAYSTMRIHHAQVSSHDRSLAQKIETKWHENSSLSYYLQWAEGSGSSEQAKRLAKPNSQADAHRLHQLGLESPEIHSFIDFTNIQRTPQRKSLTLQKFDLDANNIEFFVDAPDEQRFCYYLTYCRMSQARIAAVTMEQRVAVASFGKIKGYEWAWDEYQSYVSNPGRVWLVLMTTIGIFLLATICIRERLNEVSEHFDDYWTRNFRKSNPKY